VRKKIKIDLGPIPKPPPSFICDICGKKSEGWQLVHGGNRKMCEAHYMYFKKARYESDMDLRDINSIDTIRTILAEIQSAGKESRPPY
jgi:hypothetical protein